MNTQGSRQWCLTCCRSSYARCCRKYPNEWLRIPRYRTCGSLHFGWSRVEPFCKCGPELTLTHYIAARMARPGTSNVEFPTPKSRSLAYVTLPILDLLMPVRRWQYSCPPKTTGYLNFKRLRKKHPTENLLQPRCQKLLRSYLSASRLLQAAKLQQDLS